MRQVIRPAGVEEAIGLTRRVAITAWCLVLAAGALALALPRAASAPLVPTSGWSVDGGFAENMRPGTSDVAPDIAQHPDARFFRSWAPETGAVPGRVATPWFAAQPVFWIPIVGYPIARAIDVFLECEGSAARRAVSTGNPHDQWTQRLVVLPSDWCRTRVRVVADSNSRESYVGIGTPFSGSWRDRIKHAFPALAVLHLLTFVHAALLVAGAWVCTRRLEQPALRWSAAVVAVCCVAYGAFFAAHQSKELLRVFDAACLLLATAAILRFRGSVTRELRGDGGRWLLLLYWLSAGLLALLAAADPGAGAWNPNYRFDPAIWSTDNHLPALVAEGLRARTPVAAILGGGWHVSDRPPLMAGLLLLLRPAWSLASEAADRHWLLPGLYLVTGVTLQCTAVLAALALLRRTAWPQAGAVGVVAVVALIVSPFIVFNAIYTWPKLLAAGLAAYGATLILAGAAAPTPRQRWTAVGLAGALFGFAILSHASVALGLLALPLLFRCVGDRFRLFELATAALVAIVLWVPWSLWQSTFDPPGNALTKFALAGTFGLDDPARPLRAVVRDTYAAIGWRDWLATRAFAFETLAGRATPQPVKFVLDRASEPLADLRARDFLFPLPALRMLLVPLAVVLLSMLVRRSARRSALGRACLGLMLAGAAGLILSALLTWSVHIQHHQSYLSLLLLYCAAVTALAVLPPALRYGVFGLHLAYVLLVWVVDPFRLHGFSAAGGFAAVLLSVLVVTEVRDLLRRNAARPALNQQELRP